jgi:diguanylate cyclase (GGDEF)-like protein
MLKQPRSRPKTTQPPLDLPVFRLLHSTADTEAELRAAQPIDWLMVRVMLPLFVAGTLAIAVLWGLELSSGKISEVNRYAYPVLLALFSGSVLVLRRWPQHVGLVRWAGFLSVSLSQLGDLVNTLLQSGPLIGNYSAVTLFNWLPLIYALAFFLLEGSAAVWSACVLLALVSAGFAWRVVSPEGHPDDVTLLVNVLASHVVFIVCLTGWLRMKRLLSRQHGLAEELRVLAATDPLTGLANRRQALDELGRLVAPPAREPPPVALLCDIDHFKRINDQLGHEVGDRVLVDVADALRRATRATDVVARWGGEEFLVVLPGSPLPEALELAERLRQRVAQAGAEGAAAPVGGVTMSVGLAAHRPEESTTEWLRRTDEALYRAKHAGRDRCEAA